MSASPARPVGRLREAEAGLGRENFDPRIAHRRLKQGLIAYIREGGPFNLLTAPLIYSLIVPLAVLDAWATVYQWICFPIYRVDRVHRRKYFVIDRHALAYLNAIEKANCTFCSYANGVLAYVREVAARTEQYWCPIKHSRAVPAPHRRYRLFFDYGDAYRYRRELSHVRRRLAASARGRDRPRNRR